MFSRVVNESVNFAVACFQLQSLAKLTFFTVVHAVKILHLVSCSFHSIYSFGFFSLLFPFSSVLFLSFLGLLGLLLLPLVFGEPVGIMAGFAHYFRSCDLNSVCSLIFYTVGC